MAGSIKRRGPYSFQLRVYRGEVAGPSRSPPTCWSFCGRLKKKKPPSGYKRQTYGRSMAAS